MAIVPIVLCFGNSESDILDSASNFTNDDFIRWTGAALPTDQPVDVFMPGVKAWTPKLPYSVHDTRSITGSGANSVTFSGAVLTADQIGQWLYVKTGTTGRAQHARITAGTGTNTATVSAFGAWTPPSTDGTIEFWSDSHTCDAGCTTTVIQKLTSTVDFTSADIGKWVSIFITSLLEMGSAKIVSVTVDSITIDRALPAAPAANDPIFLLSGSGSVDGLSSYTSTNGSWRDLRFYYDFSFTYGTGYDYPNMRGLPWVAPASYTAYQGINYMPELMWNLKNSFDGDVHFVSLGSPSAYLSPHYSTIGYPVEFSWADSDTYNNWHPSGPTNLFTVLVETILPAAMQAITNAGDEPDIVGVFTTVGELETMDETRANLAFKNLILLRDKLREYIDDNGWSKRQASRIPWIMGGVASTAWSYRDTVNSGMQRIAADDSYSGYVDTTDYTFTDTVHYDADSTIALARAFYAKWIEVRNRENDATGETAALHTLSAIRTKVRRRYERNGSGNDDSDTQVNQFINDSLREMYNTFGDNAWFLRKMSTLEVSGVFPNTVLLPREVKRLLRLESSSYPGYPLTWKMTGYSDQGRQQVTVLNSAGGSYVGHYIIAPKELEQDADVAIIPPHHIEMLVMLTCKRLAEAAGNMTIAGYYASETDRLWKFVKRDVLRHDRGRQDGLYVDHGYDHWTGSGDPLWNL